MREESEARWTSQTRTLLPGTIKRIHLNTKEEIWGGNQEAERARRLAIGAAAAYGMAPAGIGHC